MKLIFLGPPGSGKGTYALRIGPKLGIPHIGTGDLFRAEMGSGSELGKKIDSYVSKANLVPDDITIEVLKKRISQDDCKNGFILDGFPRTLAQAKALDGITEIDLVINLHLSEEIIIEKMSARRICRKCGDIYNIADIEREGIRLPPLLPKKEGICDKCGGELYQRKDDSPELIKERLKIQALNPEISQYYIDKGVVVDVKVIGPPEVMVPIIMDKIKQAAE